MPGKRVTDHQVIKYKQYRQRLAAFLAHCQLMAQHHGADAEAQQRPRYVAAPDAD